MPNRNSAPKIVDAVNFDLTLKPYTKMVLKNGVNVYAIDAGTEEVLSVEAVFFAGNWYEDKNLVAASTNFLLKNGTHQKSAFQINEHFEYYGAYLNRSSGSETASVSLHCLSKHVKELLPVVRELLTESIFPEEELSTYQRNMQERLRVSLKKSDFIAGRLIDVYLYGEQHPYGKFSSESDFSALTRQQLQDFYQTYYRRGKFVLFVAGRLPGNLEQLLNDSFGDMPNQLNDDRKIIIHPATDKKHRVNNDPNGVQGSVRLARPFFNRHHPDFLKAQVLNALFGGFFSSRLMSNIREDKGYTYGIYSYLQNNVHDSAWVISTEAGKDVCEATINEVYKEMKQLQEEKVDDEELLLVKNYMMGGLLGDLNGPFQLIGRWKNILLNDLDENYFYRSVDTIKSISADTLQELARQYLVPDDFYELVVI